MPKSLTKVLIVDDERLIRQGILHYINWQDEGFEVVGEASNGEEARLLIDELKPDIVITDIVMPVMNGTDLIKYIKAHYPAIEVIVLSSYADFDYVRDTFKHGVIDYILKPKLDGEVLLETLKRVEKTADLKGHTVKQDQMDVSLKSKVDKVLKKYHHDADLDELNQIISGQVFVFVEVRRSDFSREEPLVAIEQLTSVDNIELERDDHHRLQLLFGEEDRLADALNHEHEALSSHAVSLIQSSKAKEAREITRLYDEIKLLRRYHFFLSEHVLLDYQALPVLVPSNKPFDLSIFLTLFKQEKYGVALRYMDDYLNSIKQDYQSEPNEVKNLLGNIIFNMVVALTDKTGKNDHFEQKKYQYFNAINHSTTLVEAYFHFQQFYNELTNQVMQSNQEHDNLTQLLAYIDDHYSESLSLTDLSAHFHFNPSYLSSYFSQHLNKGFSDYLTDVRINKAKELLNNHDLSIADVGSMVGYQDHSYFCKVFKKKTSLSPSRYRKETTR
ncbi:DNA-binding response regulator [Halolactibacillus miurensis]|uniref:DNA-binding response regulator n=1 Tax=Halolactibacillus miurensis TaxID=306541 RepID=A0A1I6SC29_9BACI|nr:response regulator transcription factor [Halolactibacillus miurensis]GEM04002.1 DNA-binding response regulator [Halolactibacillus miurensis]SFS74525.1 two-component system, response regulator YesN [Halolactibacillus miurensis]